ncbi:MAG: hypothetical protein LUQ36_04550 [Methanoregula sp.]|nr:hypothetical protein [Methanoregula sp.]
MDTVPVILGVLRIILGFLLLVGIPGFAISLVLFPRLTDLSVLDRLVYTAVLGITSAIAFVVFIDLMPGLELSLENLTIIASVFSAGALIVWLCERWYLNRRLKTSPGPQISEDSPDHQRYYSREINAAKDQFRQDTRTVVVYHESERLSGMNFISHSFLLDVGEEIDIQQVVENKVKGTESFPESPYPKTRYFELILLEHDEGQFSLVDDLQIYPVHITTKADTQFPGTTLQRDSLLITERIYSKTSTEEVQWVYSHDFHILAFIHAEETLAQMVDRVLGILDEIVIAVKSGVRIQASAEDQQALRAPFEEVRTEPHGSAVKTPDIPQRPEVQQVVQPRDKHRRPVILPGVQDEETPGVTEGETWISTNALHKPPAIQTRVKQEDIPKIPEFQSGVLSQKIPEQPVIQPGAEQKNIGKIPDIQPRVLPMDKQEIPLRQAGAKPDRIPTRPEVQPRNQSKHYLSPVENKLEVASIRKLQKNILRDLNMFDLTPDSFKRSQKNIEHIRIPKKADVNKKLSESEEMLDLNWLYE